MTCSYQCVHVFFYKRAYHVRSQKFTYETFEMKQIKTITKTLKRISRTKYKNDNSNKKPNGLWTKVRTVNIKCSKFKMISGKKNACLQFILRLFGHSFSSIYIHTIIILILQATSLTKIQHSL